MGAEPRFSETIHPAGLTRLLFVAGPLFFAGDIVRQLAEGMTTPWAVYRVVAAVFFIALFGVGNLPLRVRVDDSGLTAKRWPRSVSIPSDEVRSASVEARPPRGFGVRRFVVDLRWPSGALFEHDGSRTYVQTSQPERLLSALGVDAARG